MAKPDFFKVAFSENDETYYTKFNCPMDYLQEIIKEKYPKKKREKKTDENGNPIPKLRLIDLFEKPIQYDKTGKKLKRENDKHIAHIIEVAENYEKERKKLYAKAKKDGLGFDAEIEKRELFKNAVDEVSEMKLTKQTVYTIVNKLYGSNQAKSHNNGAGEYGKTIMDILYNSHKGLLLSIFKRKDQEREVDNMVS